MSQHSLFPPKRESHLLKQVVMVFLCPQCQNWLYRWYGVKLDGSQTDIYRIHQDDWKNIWLNRLETDRITDTKALVFQRISIKVSQFTSEVHKPADVALYYLKKMGEL